MLSIEWYFHGDTLETDILDSIFYSNMHLCFCLYLYYVLSMQSSLSVDIGCASESSSTVRSLLPESWHLLETERESISLEFAGVKCPAHLHFESQFQGSIILSYALCWVPHFAYDLNH